MKKLLIVALTVFTLTACKQNKAVTIDEKIDKIAPSASKADAPKIKFEKEIYDFGVITQGEKVHFDFKFTNVGKTPLIITNATATCGCTVPEYPTEPVKPGDGGIIKVIFNSTGKSGMQDKQITLTSNAEPEPEKLHMVGEVKEKK